MNKILDHLEEWLIATLMGVATTIRPSRPCSMARARSPLTTKLDGSAASGR